MGLITVQNSDSSVLQAIGRYRSIRDSYKSIYANPDGTEAHFILASFKSDGRLDRPHIVGVCIAF